MPKSAEFRHLRARKAALIRNNVPPDNPKVIAADRNLAENKTAEYVKTVLASAPPLTDDQRDRLADLLRPVREHRRERAMQEAKGKRQRA